mgnify:CR=1 FL=1
MSEIYRAKLFALLHDVGKVLVRAKMTRKDVREQVCKEFAERERYAHDGLSCQFIADSFGREYAEAFVNEKKLWKWGDWASATERIPGDEEDYNIYREPLLDPVVTSTIILQATRTGKSAEEELRSGLHKLKNETVWRSVIPMDFTASPDIYYLKDNEKAKNDVKYKEIAEELKKLSRLICMLKSDRARLITMDAMLRYLTLLVPAAIRGTLVPDTSLYGHSRLAAAIAGYDKFKLLFIDIKGIQRFISSVTGEANAAKRLRGRSYFVHFLQEALLAHLAVEFNITQVNNLVFEPGKLLLAVPQDFNLNDLKKALKEVSEWLDYQVQFAIALSDEIDSQSIYFYYDREEKRSVKFGEEVEKLLSSQEIVGEPRCLGDLDNPCINTHVGVDAYGEPSSKLFEIGKVPGWRSLVTDKLEEEDEVSLVNLISLVLGHTMRSEEGLGGSSNQTREGSKRRIRVVVLYIESWDYSGPPAYLLEDKGVGVVYIEPLKVLFLVLPEDLTEPDFEELFKEIEEKSKARPKAKWAKVITVNDTEFIDSKVLESLMDIGVEEVAFDWASFPTYHPTIVDKETNKKRMMDLDEMGNYMAIASLDVDNTGELVKALAPYPSRFVTFSLLLNFAFSMVLRKAFEDAIRGINIGGAGGKCRRVFPGGKLNPRRVALLYAGGDDLVLYGEWRDVISVLLYLREKLKGLFHQDIVLDNVSNNIDQLKIPGITVSGGITIFKSKFPIRYAYSMAKEFESRAKEEGRMLEKSTGKREGRIVLSVSEKYELPEVSQKEEMISLSWDELEDYFLLADALYRSNEVPAAYLYKVYEAGQIAEEGDKARAVVTYAYLNARTDYLNTIKQYINCLKEVTKRDSSIKLPDYDEGNWDEVLKDVMKFRVAVNMYSLMSRS